VVRRALQEKGHRLRHVNPACQASHGLGFYAVIEEWLKHERDSGHFRVSASGRVIPLWHDDASGHWIPEQHLDLPYEHVQVRLEGERGLMVYLINDDADFDSENLWRGFVDGYSVPNSKTEDEAKALTIAAAQGDHDLFGRAVEEKQALYEAFDFHGMAERVARDCGGGYLKGEVLERPWGELHPGNPESLYAVVNGHLVLVTYDIGEWHVSRPRGALWDQKNWFATVEDANAFAEEAARSIDPGVREVKWTELSERFDSWAGATWVRSDQGQHLAIAAGVGGLPWSVHINGAGPAAAFDDAPGSDPARHAKFWAETQAHFVAMQAREAALADRAADRETAAE